MARVCDEDQGHEVLLRSWFFLGLDGIGLDFYQWLVAPRSKKRFLASYARSVIRVGGCTLFQTG
jgi:hypothetical protein